jgi:hypothetical protein
LATTNAGGNESRFSKINLTAMSINNHNPYTI